jgi:hypothetical protein
VRRPRTRWRAPSGRITSKGTEGRENCPANRPSRERTGSCRPGPGVADVLPTTLASSIIGLPLPLPTDAAAPCRENAGMRWHTLIHRVLTGQPARRRRSSRAGQVRRAAIRKHIAGPGAAPLGMPVSSICARICATRPWMSDFLPTPSMIVVSSFEISTRLARLSTFNVTFSSLMERSSLITCTRPVGPWQLTTSRSPMSRTRDVDFDRRVHFLVMTLARVARSRPCSQAATRSVSAGDTLAVVCARVQAGCCVRLCPWR